MKLKVKTLIKRWRVCVALIAQTVITLDFHKWSVKDLTSISNWVFLWQEWLRGLEGLSWILKVASSNECYPKDEFVGIGAMVMS